MCHGGGMSGGLGHHSATYACGGKAGRKGEGDGGCAGLTAPNCLDADDRRCNAPKTSDDVGEHAGGVHVVGVHVEVGQHATPSWKSSAVK